MLPIPVHLVLSGLLALALAPVAQARGVPDLVFVSRNPPADPSVVPGLGPHHRAMATGGRLMLRRSNGEVRPLLPEGLFFDVSDPAVSWDGRRVAFAATPSPDSAWRIYVVDARGGPPAAVTRSDRSLDLSRLGDAASRFDRYDDLDPVWLPDDRICFATTRFPLVSETGRLLATNLFVCRADGSGLTRITSERNGAEEPSVDAVTGRIVYARWWLNRFKPSDVEPSGITTDSEDALPMEAVDVWHAISVTPDGDGIQLAGGNPRVRAETMAYQPIVPRDGTLIGVRGENLSLSPGSGALSLQAFEGRFSEARRLAGGDRGSSACAPVALPDGRIVFSYDPHGAGDYGLYVVRRDGRRLERVLDLPGTLELDAAVLAARPRPPVLPPSFLDLPHETPVASEGQLRDSINTFRFDCLNVFANAPVDAPFPDAPRATRGIRIRFYAALSRPANAGGDTAVLVREAPVTPSGAVHEHELPADAPMFEQLVDAKGRILRSSGVPAHVPGFNAGRYASGTKCVGCHAGHSALPVAVSAREGKRFNASPSAEAWASSVAGGSAGARAAVDRRTRGPAAEVAWVAESSRGETIGLRWRTPIEVDTLLLYNVRPRSSEGTNLRVRECELVFFHAGSEVHRRTLRRDLSPQGTRVGCGGIRVDAIEVRPTRTTGRVMHRAVAGLAEIEVLARLVEE